MARAHPDLYSIKRHGTNIRDCEAEPIRTPGCIQSHGVLLALRRGDLTILQISENSETLIGVRPSDVLGQSVETVLDGPEVAKLRDVLGRETVERNPVYVFTTRPKVGGVALDACVHTIDGVALLEFEPTERTAQWPPPDYYSLVKKTAARLQAAPDLASFCAYAASEVRTVTGLDRVMIYRFHPDASGEVFAEASRDDLPSWKGLRYPAHDIPKVARDIFKKLTIRPVQNAAGPLAELVPLANPDTGAALDLTYCALRGASVMYTEYLANMGVAASLTMPILRDGELWGLVACHHATPKVFSFQLRAAAEFVAHLVSLELKAVEDRENFAYIQRMDTMHLALVSRAAASSDLASMVDGAPALADGIECGGAAVFHRDRWWSVGRTPAAPVLQEFGEWLRNRLLGTIETKPFFATDQLSAEYPRAEEFADLASGVLAVPVSSGCSNVLVWFRPPISQLVTWAGNPHELPSVLGPNGPRLTPRASFELWKETVFDRSAPWQPFEIEAALKLRAMVMDLVVTRAERIAELNAQLAKSNAELDAFAYIASHDLKEPLRGIHWYASQLFEDAKKGRPANDESQARLASMLRLTVRMDGLLSSLFHFSRIGHLELEFEDVALADVLRDAIETLAARIDEHQVQLVVARELPHLNGDRVRLREIFMNLIGNALKYNDQATRRIEVGFLEPAEHPATWRGRQFERAVAGQRVFLVRDNGIGIEPKHQEQIFHMFKRLHRREAYGGGTGAGLAIVRKLVEQHGGTIWVESDLGQGATFYFTLSPSKSERGAT